MIQLTTGQLEIAAPYLLGGMVFVGEYRGQGERSITYDVKDKAGKKTGEKETSYFLQVVVEVSPPEGRPVPKLVQLQKPRDGAMPSVTAEKGDTVLVVVHGLKFDDYAKEQLVMANAVIPLPALVEAKVYEIKPRAKEGAAS
jgi:hypothetical protein